MRRGAFTILEVIIVVAIVAAISAVVLPALASRVVEGRTGHAIRAVEAAVVMARVEAVERGEMVALVAERIGDEWVLFAEPFDPHGASEEHSGPFEPPPEARTELIGFAGVRLSGGLPEVGSEESPSAEIVGTQDPMLDSELAPEAMPEPERLRIGLFFPDGGCRSPEPVYLLSAGGARHVLRVRPLTGKADVRRLPDERTEASRQREAGDELTSPLAEDEG